ncbi:MAG: aspartate--tRNA(Asn) ligase [Candidatus Nezhaarchaeales archaeon]
MGWLLRWRRTHYTQQVTGELEGNEVVLLGWVHDVRDLGKIKFLILRDREGVIQITAPLGKVSDNVFSLISSLKRESVVAVKGIVRRSSIARLGVEVIPLEIEVLNEAKSPLPLDPTGRIPADLSKRLDARYIDLRVPSQMAIFKLQHLVLNLTRKFFIERGFIEVVTPRILASATEGGAALFSVKYFEKEVFLAQSPQLYKEVLTSVFEKVFEIGTFFRAEESDTTYHLNEFVSVDMEEAFTDAEDVMKTLEDYVCYVFKGVKELGSKELKNINVELKELKKPFKRLSYEEALKKLEKLGLEVKWGADIPTQGYRKLGEEYPEPYFIVDWPTQLKPFYIKPYDENPSICEAFDLNYSWLEVASGGTRIHDKNLLIKRIKEQGLNPDSFKSHLEAFDYGMPPHAGWGLGLSRLLMVITGRSNIREVVLFPRDRWRLTP